MIDEIIIHFLEMPPKKQIFAEQILLNPMMISFSSKVKILRHIIGSEGWPKISIDALNELMNTRNQFAHSTGKWIAVVEGEGLTASLLLETVSGSGVYQETDFREAVERFDSQFERVEGEIGSIHNDLFFPNEG